MKHLSREQLVSEGETALTKWLPAIALARNSGYSKTLDWKARCDNLKVVFALFPDHATLDDWSSLRQETREEYREYMASSQASHVGFGGVSLQFAMMIRIAEGRAGRQHCTDSNETARTQIAAVQFLFTIVPYRGCDALLGDMEERYAALLQQKSYRDATIWFWRQVLYSFSSLTLDAVKKVWGLEKLIERYRRIG